MKRKIYFFVAAVCLTVLLVFLPACQGGAQEENSRLLTQDDLSNCTVTIYNMTCPDTYKVRTADSTFSRELAAYLVRMEKFRPILSSDVILGKTMSETAIFTKANIRYTVSFDEAEKQLSLDYIHRDSPVVAVEKTEFDDAGRPHSVWRWYATMSAADYAAAFETVRTYAGGEITDLT